MYTHVWAHRHSKHTCRMDLSFLMTIRSYGTLHSTMSIGLIPGLGGVLVKGMEGMSLFCWLPREVVGGIQLQAFLCAVNWPSVGKTFFSDEEWSLSACQNWGNVLCLCISVSVCLLVCLSLSLLPLVLSSCFHFWQSLMALGFFLVSHMVLIRAEKFNRQQHWCSFFPSLLGKKNVLNC